MTIKEIENIFLHGDVTDDLIESCRRDARKSVQTILRRYERTQRERERLDAMYVYERAAVAAGPGMRPGVRARPDDAASTRLVGNAAGRMTRGNHAVDGVRAAAADR